MTPDNAPGPSRLPPRPPPPPAPTEDGCSNSLADVDASPPAEELLNPADGGASPDRLEACCRRDRAEARSPQSPIGHRSSASPPPSRRESLSVVRPLPPPESAHHAPPPRCPPPSPLPTSGPAAIPLSPPGTTTPSRPIPLSGLDPDHSTSQQSRPPRAHDESNMSLLHQLPLLLHCPLCKPSRILVSPITLRCGHTICAEHVLPPSLSSSSLPSSSHTRFSPAPASAPAPAPATATTSSDLRPLSVSRCPIPTCNSAPPVSAFTSAVLHPASTVTYLPAPATPSSGSQTGTPLPSPTCVDVTANKIITLVQDAQAWFTNDRDREHARVPAYAAESDEETDSETDGDVDGVPAPSAEDLTEGLYLDSGAVTAPDSGNIDASLSHNRYSTNPASPNTRQRQRSPSPHPRPRKRRRRLHPRPRSRRDPPAIVRENERRDPQSRFEKELRTELTCEICFGLLLQPTTTPCQHVSSHHQSLP
ncbi:uncharacterized protein FIBRA_03782 [Fibroporia radiculosa]|uniref:Zinc finger RING-type eukaryotic domain-containing protein n=1 Tax=Fibroporia radiculosa TaxID=599839 RepID=J4HW64_9APHY|nr:uncharacterized protein FIBRA_03782 [Fibroporia radiculosa]CCM01717.1 predicted protein [Fibroporia radiculosa]